MHSTWNPPVIDPTNPIQPGDYPNLEEYLSAVNLASLVGAAMNTVGHHGDSPIGGVADTENSNDNNQLERKS
jgi:hypothetical protein